MCSSFSVRHAGLRLEKKNKFQASICAVHCENVTFPTSAWVQKSAHPPCAAMRTVVVLPSKNTMSPTTELRTVSDSHADGAHNIPNRQLLRLEARRAPPSHWPVLKAVQELELTIRIISICSLYTSSKPCAFPVSLSPSLPPSLSHKGLAGHARACARDLVAVAGKLWNPSPCRPTHLHTVDVEEARSEAEMEEDETDLSLSLSL